MKTWEIQTVDELELVVKEVLKALRERQDAGSASVLALHGELGAGKTTFTQQLAKQLGVDEVVTSPTFVVMKNYQTTDEKFSALSHIDAYRIESVDEMRPLHFSELLNQTNTLVCIEWAERIAELLPSDAISLTFTIQSDHRLITADYA